MIKLYIANLAAYNRGHLIGEFITLPLCEDELSKELEAITNLSEQAISLIQGQTVDNNEDYNEGTIVLDYETDLNIQIREFSNIWKLNEELIELDNLPSYKQNRVIAVLDAGIDSDILNIINEIEDYEIYSHIHNNYELGVFYLQDDTIPNHIKNYIDYEAYGRDLNVNFAGEFTEYGYVKKEE